MRSYIPKKLVLGMFPVVLALFGFLGYRYADARSVVLTVGDGCVPRVALNTGGGRADMISLWQDAESGEGYFFLPAFAGRHKILLGDIGEDSLRIDGKLLKRGDIFTWEEGRAYEMQITDEAYEAHTYRVIFMKSENIPAVFIDTASGSMEYLAGDKEHEETGTICVVEANGNTEYRGALERISGRGNSTWDYGKKPYAIKLTEKYPLCGLDKGDKWRLLALWREGSKMNNKVAMDLAEELGLSYSAQGTWVDLYLNGEYAGNYLLAESVSVGEGRVEIADLEKENRRYNDNIDLAEHFEEENEKGYLLDSVGDVTGGYLIEKDHPRYYEAEKAGFVTSDGYQFTVRAPQHASGEQVRYIQDFVENIEGLMREEKPEVWRYLDMESFVKRFLVDELSLNIDAGLTSMYFYKEKGEDILYSGPAWDYDNAFGDGDSGAECDYEYTVLESCDDVSDRLDWYVRAYTFPEVRERITEEYAALLPFLRELLDERIDAYAQEISASVQMNSIRWAGEYAKGDPEGRYADYEANVRYLKFYIAKRLNWLCERWDVPHETFLTPSSGERHLVTFVSGGRVVAVTEVEDGAELSVVPEYDETVWQGWFNRRNDRQYRRQVPIYEDTVFYSAGWE